MKRPFLVGLVLVTAATAAFVAAGLPGLRQVPGWFYAPQARGLGDAWAFALWATGGAALGGLAMALYRRRRGRAGAAVLFVLALGSQLAMIPLDARGTGSVWKRLTHGHGEFIRIARSRRGRELETLRNYERLVRERELGVFAPSKPPGAVGVYMALDAIGRWQPVRDTLAPLTPDVRRHPQLEGVAATAALALLLMPLTTALVVPALAWLARRLFGDPVTSCGAALLFTTAPAVLLITYHLDGALYPLLAVIACGAATAGMREDGYVRSVLAGLILAAGVFVSFSLLPVVLLVLGCVALVAIERARGGEPGRQIAFRAGWQVAALAAGFVAMLAVLRGAFDFHLALRLERAIGYHEQWKGGVPSLPWRGWALVEFSLYAGFPLIGAVLLRTGGALRRLLAGHVDGASLGSVALVLLIGGLSLVAGTNEVARLWLFLMPFLALCAATGLRAAGRNGNWRASLGWLATCQALVAVVMKANQVW